MVLFSLALFSETNFLMTLHIYGEGGGLGENAEKIRIKNFLNCSKDSSLKIYKIKRTEIKTVFRIFLYMGEKVILS